MHLREIGWQKQSENHGKKQGGIWAIETEMMEEVLAQKCRNGNEIRHNPIFLYAFFVKMSLRLRFGRNLHDRENFSRILFNGGHLTSRAEAALRA